MCYKALTLITSFHESFTGFLNNYTHFIMCYTPVLYWLCFQQKLHWIKYVTFQILHYTRIHIADNLITTIHELLIFFTSSSVYDDLNNLLKHCIWLVYNCKIKNKMTTHTYTQSSSTLVWSVCRLWHILTVCHFTKLVNSAPYLFTYFKIYGNYIALCKLINLQCISLAVTMQNLLPRFSDDELWQSFSEQWAC